MSRIDRQRQAGRINWQLVNTWIIAANIAVFVLDLLLKNAGLVYVFDTMLVQMQDGSIREMPIYMGPLEYFGHFSAQTAIREGQVWRFLSFQFLHANFAHIIFNMIGMMVFGPLVESYLGSRRYLAFYLICGMCGPVIYLVFAEAGLLSTTLATPLIGASAGLFGVVIAAAVLAPHAEVMLLFPPMPVKLRHLAIFFVALAVYTVIFFGHRNDQNAGGEAAHLGGAAMGFLLIRRPWLLNFFERLPIGPPSNIRFAPKRKSTKN